MRIFEFHFNPKAKEDLIFDSFCYEPENVYEKRLGSLFLVGEIKNALPQNLRFLDNFVSFFKREYYSSPIKFSPEAALKLGLKKSNEFLEGISKSGDVSWLGNLNLLILNLKNFDLNLTKVGAIKILLLRQGQIIDIGKNLEFEDIEPYPLKIFGKIVTGKLAESDILLVLTKEVFNFFAEQPKLQKGKVIQTSKNLLKQIAEIQPFEEKKLRAVFKTKEEELLKISGVCLLLLLTKEVWPKIERQRAFTFQKKAERFSLKQAFLPLAGAFKKIYPFRKALSKFDRLKQKFSKLRIGEEDKSSSSPFAAARVLEEHSFFSTLRRAAARVPKVHPARSVISNKVKVQIKKPEIKLTPIFRKNLVLVSSLILVIVLGFFIFKAGEQAKLKELRLTLTGIRENMSQAENYLTLNNEKKSYEILKEALRNVLPVTEEKSALQEEAVSLKDSIQKSLEKISKLERVTDPSLLFEFDEKEFIPQKMVFFQNNLYLFSPVSDNIYKLSLTGEKNVLETRQRFNEAVALAATKGEEEDLSSSPDNQILFFQKPNLIFFLKNGSLSQPISLSLPYPDFDPKTLAVYRSSLYFLDQKNGEIIKYPAPLAQNKDFPQTWLAKDTNKAMEAKSIAIDGPIWVLNKDNTISHYFGGNLKETLTLDFFPEPENLSSIQALYELFYVLEPAQKRIIVLTKTGDIIKQYQSEKFDNLKDFAVSGDGKIIWLLNGTKVFELSF